jgi:hypothetical protein
MSDVLVVSYIDNENILDNDQQNPYETRVSIVVKIEQAWVCLIE